MAVVEVSIIPLGVPGSSLSGHVARVLKVLQESSLQFELTAMGTIISGDLEKILQVLRRMHESLFFAGEVAGCLPRSRSMIVVTSLPVPNKRSNR